MGARVTRCSGNATGAQRRAYSRGCVASTASRPVAVGVGGAERGAPMSQRAYRRVRGAATPKPPVAKEGATGSLLAGLLGDSNCLGLSSTLNQFRAPRGPMFEHRIQDDQQLPHAR